MAVVLLIACSDRSPMLVILEDAGVDANLDQPHSIAWILKLLLQGKLIRKILFSKGFLLSKVLSWESYDQKTTLILTDSGGLQEEAPSLGKHVLVMRDTTERPEGVEAGTVKLVGTNKQKIVYETMRLLNDSEAYKKWRMLIIRTETDQHQKKSRKSW